MPDHVHLVIGRHSRSIRQIIGHLKARATSMLRHHETWPTDDRPVWGEHGRNNYLSDRAAVERAIR
jgi:REP element-mobilizing transposase RayT